MRKSLGSVTVWLVLGLLLLLPLQGYTQVDPGSMVLKDFLQKLLKQLFAIEMLRQMGPIEGHNAVNQAYEQAKSDVDSYYRNRQGKLTKRYEVRLEGKDVIHPDPQTKQIIDSCNREMDDLLAKWKQDLQELEEQRKGIIEAFSEYWAKNTETIEKF